MVNQLIGVNLSKFYKRRKTKLNSVCSLHQFFKSLHILLLHTCLLSIPTMQIFFQKCEKIAFCEKFSSCVRKKSTIHLIFKRIYYRISI